MKKRVMVVDNDYSDLHMMSKVLQDHGYEVITAKNGDECLHKLEEGDLRRHPPSLVLLELMLPGTPREVILRGIRDHSIRIVYLSSMAINDIEKKQMLMDPLVDDILHKPFNVQDFLRKVAKSTGG